MARFSLNFIENGWILLSNLVQNWFSNQRNISLQFWDFIINFSLIAPCSIIFIFVPLLSKYWPILVDFQGSQPKSIISNVVHFLRLFSRIWAQFSRLKAIGAYELNLIWIGFKFNLISFQFHFDWFSWFLSILLQNKAIGHDLILNWKIGNIVWFWANIMP